MSDGLRMGIYRHYKGALYQVLGLAHDANALDLYRQLPDDPYSHALLESRTVVVYIGLQLDAAHLGPRLAVRTLDDFTAVVHTEDGSVCMQERCGRIVGQKFADRFTYLGPELTAEMLGEVE